MRSSWGPVFIEKKSTIEVADVFNAVWDYLQKPITLSDYDAILASDGWERCKKIQYAMYRRCWSSAALYDYMVSQGIKRVDLLEGSSVYWGIWVCYNPDGSWYLSVGFLPRSRSA
ncbi:hypothetical protein DFH11DRAFT_1514819 [Phellopilus nigrolimitatus]|nr:hypothetical protein DFH11DRAFT_1514819 [Phellopilus nigrolimitatus]